jgi:hypothetical protein
MTLTRHSRPSKRRLTQAVSLTPTLTPTPTPTPIPTPAPTLGTPNTQVCADCHEFLKGASLLLGQTIRVQAPRLYTYYGCSCHGYTYYGCTCSGHTYYGRSARAGAALAAHLCGRRVLVQGRVAVGGAERSAGAKLTAVARIAYVIPPLECLVVRVPHEPRRRS